MGLLSHAAGAAAGPWSQLPVAVSELQRRPDGAAAREVLAAAEASVLEETTLGHLEVVVQLVQTYQELVQPLADGDRRVARLHRRVARALVTVGDATADRSPMRAGTAWALAARYHPETGVLERLASLVVPDEAPEDGARWVSPVDGATLVWHPPLRFHMGCTDGDRACLRNEKTSRWVEVPGVWMQRGEVTVGQYRRCVSAGACGLPGGWQGLAPSGDENGLPVTGISWRQARGYALWSGRRLPSESEWERAARGRELKGRFPWGDQMIPGRANLLGIVGDDVFVERAPTGQFPATGWGMLDMAGNVWEWCEDIYHHSLISAPRDGRPRTEGGHGRVVRGGSWRRGADFARVSSRSWQEDDYAHDDVGFRTAMDPISVLPPGRLVTLAERAFPLVIDPVGDLARSRLDAADRRYLGRRTITWLVLEGRISDALPQAVRLLRQEPSDPVGRDLLERVELEVLADVRDGRLSRVEHLLVSLRAESEELRQVADRLHRLSGPVVEELQSTIRSSRRRGEAGTLRAALRITELLSPRDDRLGDLQRRMMPSAGAQLRWRRDGKEMIWCPAGRFTMGAAPDDRDADDDELPPHEVRLDGFWMDRTEVTNGEYRRCVEAGFCDSPRRTVEYDDPGRSDHPVLWVDWYQARQYARWSGKRLPSEAEWEYAARAGVSSRYPWGDRWQESAANAFGSRGAETYTDAAPVGSFGANAWGLVEMTGNAWEWVEDGYHTSYIGAPGDATAWLPLVGGVEAPPRVVRGGGFTASPVRLRLSERDQRPPDDAGRSTGFRCVVDG